ncbi:PA14 domain-containing protein [Streptomyces sp. TLI_105]|uniref:PA14 domain-containing protein n=1 Tax=Streptomyces sp. TLI_105 TaxID=1881019 RepID=UPI00089BD73B|nr:PA14 domain-containing protein [Streptomyces sp. TLI_105]SED02362.1 PA14 domain-containing protein [Streptomyces sp. TLI_105]
MTRTRLSALAATAALAASGGLLTATPAAAAVACVSPVWKAEYFANSTFSGTPKLTTCDSAIAENYGYGDPTGVTLPVDNFSVRWSVTRDFGSGGPFTFAAETQDGIRVNLDGVRKIDLWKNVSTNQKATVNLTVPAGKHTISVYYAAWTGTANVKFAYAPRTSATVDKVRPLAPSVFYASHDPGLGKTTVYWNANKEMDLAGYSVHRRPSTSTTWTRVSGTALLTTRSYVDNTPPTGQSYVYEVRARDKAGNESAGSNDWTVYTLDRTAPATPTGVTVSTDNNQNTLHWRAAADAVRYEVEAADQPTGPFTVLPSHTGGPITGLSYWDGSAPLGVPRYYRVRAFDAVELPSAYSAVVSGNRIDSTPPPAPTDLRGVAEVDATVLSWDMAGALDVDIAYYGGYRVYRSPGTALDPADLTRVACDPSEVPGSEPIRISCTDQDMAPGSHHTYAVTAVDPVGNESPLSAPITVRSGDRVAPAPVVDLEATPRADGMLLTWKPPADDDVVGYLAYQGVTRADGTIAWSSCSDGTSNPLAMVCSDVPDGQARVYAVIAMDRWTNFLSLYGPDITKVSASELDLRPSVNVTDDWNLSGYLAWSDVTTSAPSLGWGCFQAESCAQITGYRLSRWNPATKAYEPLHTGLLPATNTGFVDRTTVPGQTYFYTFQALRADGTTVATHLLSTVRPALV